MKLNLLFKRKKSMKKILVLLVSIIAIACSNSKPIKLVNNGESQYTIFTSVTPSIQEKRAAKLLQKFV